MIDLLRAVALGGAVLVGAPLMTFLTVLAAGMANETIDDWRAERRAKKGAKP